MSFDILAHVASMPSTSPALARAITAFLNRERAFHEGKLDLTVKLIRQIPIERMLLEERAYASYRHCIR